GGRSTGHSLAPSTQIQFMNNQSKKCLSEQHCRLSGAFSCQGFSSPSSAPQFYPSRRGDIQKFTSQITSFHKRRARKFITLPAVFSIGSAAAVWKY
ncbi:hypothetical protein, partial [Aeromonas sp. R5-1]|uniref:hypothetical protein n=1 Tax=Aeromonas sp. R5-1 TaxID=3138467 RepID=UPI0034A18D77